jgi:hypothetical protein
MLRLKNPAALPLTTSSDSPSYAPAWLLASKGERQTLSLLGVVHLAAKSSATMLGGRTSWRLYERMRKVYLAESWSDVKLACCESPLLCALGAPAHEGIGRLLSLICDTSRQSEAWTGGVTCVKLPVSCLRYQTNEMREWLVGSCSPPPAALLLLNSPYPSSTREPARG